MCGPGPLQYLAAPIGLGCIVSSIADTTGIVAAVAVAVIVLLFVLWRANKLPCCKRRRKRDDEDDEEMDGNNQVKKP